MQSAAFARSWTDGPGTESGELRLALADLALPLLATVVYTNVSEILAERLPGPSLLQLLILGFAAVATYRRELFDPVAGLRTPLAILLLAWCVLLFGSGAWAWSPSLADARAAEAAKSLAILLLVVGLARSWRSLRWTLAALTGSATIFSLLTFIQLALGNAAYDFGGLARAEEATVWGSESGVRVGGPLGDPNFFAQILLLTIPPAILLGLASRSRAASRLWLGAAAVVAAATVMTYSRGAVLAGGLVVLLIAAFSGLRWRHFAIPAVAAVLAGMLLLPGSALGRRLATLRPGLSGVELPDSSFEKRQLLARAGLRMFADHPLLGVGAGNFEARYRWYADQAGSTAPQYDDPGARQFPHSLYVQTAAEIGLSGLVLLIAILGLPVGRLLSLRRHAVDPERRAILAGLAIAIVGYATTSLFLHADFQRYLWLLLGLAAAAARLAITNEEAAP